MSMYFCPLYSGSSGNCLFVQYGTTRLLIDAGKSGKTVADALHRIGAEPETISGLMITHEHSDHISGVGILARRYGIPVYATRETWMAMDEKIGPVPADLRREISAGSEFWLGDIGVSPFSIPHDAADPVGYRLYGGKNSISTATDLGCFTENVYSHIRGSDMILLESNHDPEMLKRNPRYNAALKKRILGNLGHLSNEACAEALIRLIRGGTRNVLLGHLSGENNTPELAMDVNRRITEQEGIVNGRDVNLGIALRDQIGRVYTLEEGL